MTSQGRRSSMSSDAPPVIPSGALLREALRLHEGPRLGEPGCCWIELLPRGSHGPEHDAVRARADGLELLAPEGVPDRLGAALVFGPQENPDRFSIGLGLGDVLLGILWPARFGLRILVDRVERGKKD